MTFSVEIPERVELQIKEQALHSAEDKPTAALQWYQDIFYLLETLNALPNRCPLAPESDHLEFEVRHLIIGNYRVLFSVEGESVLILDFKSNWQKKPK